MRGWLLVAVAAACSERAPQPPKAAPPSPSVTARAPSPAPLVPPAPSAPPSRFVEARLATLPHGPEVDHRKIVWGATGRAVAWVERAGGRERVAVNGVPGRWFDHVQDLDLAPGGATPIYVGNDGGVIEPGSKVAFVHGGRFYIVVGDRLGEPLDHALILHDQDWTPSHFVYVATRQLRQRVVSEGKPGPEVDDVDVAHLEFLPDGRPIYPAKIGGRAHMVVGDDVGPSYDRVGSPQIAANGAFAYVAHETGGARVVLGREPGPLYDAVDDLAISPAGAPVYEATRGRVTHAIVGDRKLGPYDRTLYVTFSRTGRVAFAAKRGPGWMVVVDGKAGPAFAEVGDIPYAAVFSDDGRHVAHLARLKEKSFVMRDKRREGPWSKARMLVWSRDGRHLAYLARARDASFAVLDGKAGPAFEEVGPLEFGNDGTLFYEARRRGPQQPWCIVRGTVPACYDDVGEPNLIAGDQKLNLTTDGSGRHLAFRARKGRHWLVVLDGVEGPAVEELWAPVFSPDQSQIGYGARVGDELWWKVTSVR